MIPESLLVVYVCPSCLHESIGPSLRTLACAGCGMYISKMELEYLKPHSGVKCWIRRATDLERSKLDSSLKAKWCMRMADLFMKDIKSANHS